MPKTRPPELLNIYRNDSDSFVVRLTRIKNRKKIVDKSKSFNTSKVGSTNKAKRAAMILRDNLRKQHPITKRNGRSRRHLQRPTVVSSFTRFINRQIRGGQSREEAFRNLQALLGRNK